MRAFPRSQTETRGKNPRHQLGRAGGVRLCNAARHDAAKPTRVPACFCPSLSTNAHQGSIPSLRHSMPLIRHEAKSERTVVAETPRAIRPIGVSMQKHGETYGKCAARLEMGLGWKRNGCLSLPPRAACDGIAKGFRRLYQRETKCKALRIFHVSTTC
jgi:hypothetical protein